MSFFWPQTFLFAFLTLPRRTRVVQHHAMTTFTRNFCLGRQLGLVPLISRFGKIRVQNQSSSGAFWVLSGTCSGPTRGQTRGQNLRNPARGRNREFPKNEGGPRQLPAMISRTENSGRALPVGHRCACTRVRLESNWSRKPRFSARLFLRLFFD